MSPILELSQASFASSGECSFSGSLSEDFLHSALGCGLRLMTAFQISTLASNPGGLLRLAEGDLEKSQGSYAHTVHHICDKSPV